MDRLSGRKWLRRGVLLMLAALGIGLWLLWPWLFMPDDLRRMQGSWREARVETQNGVAAGDRARWHFLGSRVTCDTTSDTLSITLDPDKRRFRIDVALDEERTIFGYEFQMPSWLCRSDPVMGGEYEFDGGRLVFWFQGGPEAFAAAPAEMPQWRKIHMQR